MSDAFLSSDDFDEQAHHLYNEGRYDEALTVLKEGIALYPTRSNYTSGEPTPTLRGRSTPGHGGASNMRWRWIPTMKTGWQGWARPCSSWATGPEPCEQLNAYFSSGSRTTTS